MKRLLMICVAFSVSLMASDGFAGKKKKRKKKVKAESSESQDGAAGPEDTMSYAEPYGMAGCGLGSIIFKSNTGGAQSTAATSNGIGANQLSAITSGTSNCVEPGADMASSVERSVYVSANLASLSKEAAQGEGQHLSAFADVLGCADSQTLPAFKTLSQEKHAEIFNSDEPQNVVRNYMQVVKSNAVLAENCARIGA